MIWFIVGIIIVFLLVALPIANYSNSQLFATYEKYNNVPCYAKITGGQFALKISNEIFNGKISVARTKGVLTDAYSSRAKTVVLSDETCETASVASLTVVSHEFGHAMQHMQNSKKFKLNIKLMKATRYLGYFMMPLAVIGLFIVFVFPKITFVGFIFLALSGCILLTAILLKAVSIPLEKDASKRGLKLLKDLQILETDEMAMAKDLLNAALLTYIGDFFRAILWWTFLTKKSKLF